MATNESFIIADTSGVISLAVTTDHNHEQAVAETERLKERSSILVPYEVLLETVNTLGKRFGQGGGASEFSLIFVIISRYSGLRKTGKI